MPIPIYSNINIAGIGDDYMIYHKHSTLITGQMLPDCIVKHSCADEHAGVQPELDLSGDDLMAKFALINKCREMVQTCGCGEFVEDRYGGMCVDKEEGCTAPCTCERNGLLTQLEVSEHYHHLFISVIILILMVMGY